MVVHPTVPKTANHEGVVTLLFSHSLFYLLIRLPIVVTLSFVYLFYSSIFDLLENLWARNFPHSNNFCKANKKSEGLISRQVCPKTGRTYITRFLDRKRDIEKAAVLFANGFAVNAAFQFFQADTASLHALSHFWFKAILEAPESDVFVQEWEEQQKLVGGCVVQLRRDVPFFESVYNEAKHFTYLFKLLVVCPKASYQMFLLNMVLPAKAELMWGSSGSDMCYVRCVAVEKGFQNCGIGTNLLSAALKHADSFGFKAYLESFSTTSVPLYERLRFNNLEEWKILPDAPSVFPMLRPAQSKHNHVKEM